MSLNCLQIEFKNKFFSILYTLLTRLFAEEIKMNLSTDTMRKLNQNTM